MDKLNEERYFFEVDKEEIPLVRALLKENNIMFRLITNKKGLFIVKECDGNAVTVELVNNKIKHSFGREIKLPEIRPLSGISDLPSEDLLDIWMNECTCKHITGDFSRSRDNILRTLTNDMVRLKDLEYAGITKVTDKLLFVVNEFMLLIPESRKGFCDELCNHDVYAGIGVDTHYVNLRRFFKWLCDGETLDKSDYIYILNLINKKSNP